MENKKRYYKPILTISEFSVRDIIRASIPVPCPDQDDPCDEDFKSLDDQILNGTIK